MQIKSFLMRVIMLSISLLAGCSSMRGSKSVNPPPGQPLVQEKQADVQVSPAAPSAARPGAEQVAAEQAVLLQKAQQDLLAYEEAATATSKLARAVVIQKKLIDYSACRLIPPELKALQHYGQLGPFMTNWYRGQCVLGVEWFILEKKNKNLKEEVLPSKGKKKP